MKIVWCFKKWYLKSTLLWQYCINAIGCQNRLSEFRKSFGKWMQWEWLIMFMRMPKRLFLKRTNSNQKNGWFAFNWWGVSFTCISIQRKTTLASAAANKKLIDSGLDPYDV
jgi:hypothetical protein